MQVVIMQAVRDGVNIYHMEVPLKVEIMHVLLLLSGGIILLQSPIESPNKRLNSVEKKIYRRKSIMYLVIVVFVYVLMIGMNKMLYTRTVMYSICLVAVGLIQMEKIKAKMKRIHMQLFVHCL